MTMKRYDALHQYWQDTPPPDLLIAAYLQAGQFAKGAKRKRAAPTTAASKKDDGMMPRFDNRGLPIPGSRVPRPPVLDDNPGTMKDLFELLKRSGRKSITLN